MSLAPPISENSPGVSAPPARRAASAPDVAPGYRPDIDGLRGLAVLSLMAVHLFPQWSQGGGLVGLDMFFVISGYLISNALMRAHAGGHFSLTA
ncbi:MAG: acyltransferase, partial [Burkholderiaceae bacterium]|nr:acyltransferase [Burkholderiaceae bacterium]